MLRLNRVAKTLLHLPERTLSDTGILERHDLQAMILASPEAFLRELREERVTLLAHEVRPLSHR